MSSRLVAAGQELTFRTGFAEAVDDGSAGCCRSRPRQGGSPGQFEAIRRIAAGTRLVLVRLQFVEHFPGSRVHVVQVLVAGFGCAGGVAVQFSGRAGFGTPREFGRAPLQVVADGIGNDFGIGPLPAVVAGPLAELELTGDDDAVPLAEAGTDV